MAVLEFFAYGPFRILGRLQYLRLVLIAQLLRLHKTLLSLSLLNIALLLGGHPAISQL